MILGDISMENNLSYNEKLILFGIIKYPLKSDNEICNIFNLKKSTFSTIKKRLFQKGYFRSIRVPIFQHLGCELLIVSYGKLNQNTTLKERLNISRKLWLGTPEHFYIVSESNQAIILSISRNITDFEERFEDITQIYNEYEFFEGRGFTTILFPFNLFRIFSFFDYAPFLNKYFKLNFKDESNENNLVSKKVVCQVRNRDMTKLEKRVYFELVRNPEFSDYKIAEVAGCSRHTVSRMKSEFYNEKIMRTTKIVNLEKLGLGILAFTHSRFNPKTTIDERKKYLQKVIDLQTPIFNVSRRLEGVMLTPFRNYTEYQDIHGEVTRFSARENLLQDDPTTMLLSIPRMSVLKDHENAMLVKKLLKL
jgi:DNA-binding MarR family transcriptional regulator